MAAYMAKMDAIRTGEAYTSFDGVASYDPSKDLASHASSLRRPVVETETYLSQAQLAELRRVQNERIEMGKRKTLGLEVKRDLGVRMDGSSASFSLLRARLLSALVADPWRLPSDRIRQALSCPLWSLGAFCTQDSSLWTAVSHARLLPPSR
jgi:hypothetical protein